MSGHDRTFSEDIYGPNFGNALPSAPEAPEEDDDAPSSNTTLEHQNVDNTSESQTASSDVDQEDDFFDRYPGATPKKRNAVDAAPVRTEGDNYSGISNGQSDLSPESVQAETKSAVTGTEQISVSTESAAVTHVSHAAVPESTDRTALLQSKESLKEHMQHLHDAAAGPLESHPETGEQTQEQVPLQEPTLKPEQIGSSSAGSDTDEIVNGGLGGPEAHYEHQSEITEMEAAVDESAAAPLMDDEEVLPTVVVASDRTSFGMDEQPGQPGSIAHTVLETQTTPPAITRSFTTDFADLATGDQPNGGSSQQFPLQPADTDTNWPTFGDDKTFGEILNEYSTTTSQEPSRDQPEERELPPTQLDGHERGPLLDSDQTDANADSTTQSFRDEKKVLAESNLKEDDLAAAWGAALDDDDLLEESNELDPSTLFGDDDNDFLVDEDDSFLAPSHDQSRSQPQLPAQPMQQQSVSHFPQSTQSQSLQSNAYVVPGAQTFVQHGRSVGTPDTGLHDLYSRPTNSHAPDQHQSARPGPISAQSFADKSKGGYQSPYDLPMEVSKPRRRQQQQITSTGAGTHVAPLRTSSQSSSFLADSGQPPQGPPQQLREPSVQTSPSSSHAAAVAAASHASSSLKAIPKGDDSFFADLPVAPKFRARPSAAYIPQAGQTPPVGPPTSMQQPTSQAHRSLPAGPPQQHNAPSGIGLGFRQPERLPLLPDQPTASPAQTLDALPVGISRYSPGAPSTSTAVQTRYSPAPTAPASINSRYSPAPTMQPGQAKSRYGASPSRNPSTSSTSHYFAPRTSSPLASHSDKSHPPLPADVTSPMSPSQVNGTYALLPAASLPSASETVLQRSRTQSPSTTMKNPRVAMQNSERPTSAIDASSRRSYAPSLQPSLIQNQTDNRNGAQKRSGPVLPHRRQFSRELAFASPQDERSQDPLQRWQGHPIFSWTAGGSVASSFPQQTPFYAAGHAIPAIKCTAGSISLQDATTFLPMDGRNAAFPGPLAARSKGRKKEVLTWLSGKVEDLERNYEAARLDFSMDSSLKKRVEEKVILWKITKVLVDHDGVLEGKPDIVADTRRILLPDPGQMDLLSDIQSPLDSTIQTEPVDKQVLVQLREALLEGNRDRAVWLAEENKLWGHAMLIASTLGPDVWKQVIQSFVRSQVKSMGSDARSMAALYQIFAGNSEECVDELVPPSARAGFQMISKTNGSVSGNPLEGLDQWRETLGLVVSNRTSNDSQSLISLGKLLASYGRIEAAHTCYLFARSFVKHSGADDAETHFALLGANHNNPDEAVGDDLDSILLTEIYEWSSSLSMASTSVPYVPHLQSFKLVHAQQLAANGLKTKAQQYCSHITSAYTSTTRPSQYYHPVFTQAVTDLSAFLAQSPHDGKGSSSLFRKEVMNKASSGAASWFTKFVSGDDDSQTSGSGPGNDQAGTPFGGVNSATPPISRATSSAELYNPIAGGTVTPGITSPNSYAQLSNPYAPTTTSGRYAPSVASQALGTESRPIAVRSTSKYAPQDSPRASMYASQVSSSPAKSGNDQYRPNEGLQQATPSYMYDTSHNDSSYSSSSRRGSAQITETLGSYEPKPVVANVDPSTYTPPIQESNEFPAPPGPGVANAEVNPESALSANGGYEAPTSGYGYEPPTTSYQPYEPGPDSPGDGPKPKKKDIMDLDDEEDNALAMQAAALRKSQADREADEAFRKAAEADASRDNKDDPDNKKGWFGGWFKKDANAAPGPIRAKLGDQSSFVYDESLKKWVNKKGGAETEITASATPPPPRGGPSSRVTSGAMGPPSSGTPSRVASASGMMGPPMSARPPTSGSGPILPGSGPPSRAGTPASQELSGGPMNGAAHAPPSRPSTGMSNASNLDDLLGAPGGSRKASGTVKGKKKGGRYVDVMAGK
nr:copii coat assembly protein sec16 [Quercus suber]